MRRHLTAWFFVASLALSVLCVATQISDYRVGSLARQEAQPIYSTNLNDPWNRIFYLLFTRTVETRLTDDFKVDGPFVESSAMGNPALRVTSRTYPRIESGDRAVEPLYPNFFSSKGSEPILTDPGFTELKQALVEACTETTPRTPLARALMQADAWAAYDVVSWSHEYGGQVGEHARTLLPLLNQLIAKLALTSEEIKALPHNYLAGQGAMRMPPLFDENSGWVEVEWLPHRSHDSMGGNRHAARIFLKPPAKPRGFLDEMNQRIRKHNEPLPEGIHGLDGAALLTEVLLIDRGGHVVPSPLISDLQLRTNAKDGQGNFKASTVEEYELSRKLMLTDPASGGFIHRTAEEPAYLPSSGNDFTFASPHMTGAEPKPPVLATLRRRCETCHFESAVFSLMIIPMPGRSNPPVRQLRSADDEHALYVAGEKTKQPDFQSLHLGR